MLADINTKLLLGDDPFIKEPDDILSGSVLKIIAKAQRDKILAPHTYGKIEQAVGSFKKKEKAEAETKAASKGKKKQKSPSVAAPKKLEHVEVRVSDTQTVIIPGALADVIGPRKYTVLAVVGLLTTGWFDMEGLKSLVEQGKLVASEATIKKVLRMFDNPAVCEGVLFETRGESGMEEYHISSN